jgi:predicted outer membrane protein
MKRPRIIVALCLSLSAMLPLAGACGGDDSDRGPVGQVRPRRGAENGSPGNHGNQDKENPKEITSQGQALQVVLDNHESMMREAEAAIPRVTQKAVKAFAQAVLEEHAKAKGRLEELIAKKGLATENNPLSDRLEFNSMASIGHIKNVGRDMVDNAYMTRAVNASKNFIEVIDTELAQVLTDEDVKLEVRQVRAQLVTEVSEGERVQGTLPVNAPPLPPGFGNAGDLPPIDEPDSDDDPDPMGPFLEPAEDAGL